MFSGYCSTEDTRTLRLYQKLLESPFTDEGTQVRPRWEDGSPAYTRKIFGYQERYDFAEGCPFPIITIRKINWRAALDEILWIYQKASNNIHDLNSHIWDAWADDNGTIGRAYGYQIARITDYPDSGPMNQMDKVIWDLRNNPMSRSIMTNMYQIPDLPNMHLRPCCYATHWNVTRKPMTGEMFLNMVMFQRSMDTLTAGNWNVVQYVMLMQMVAQVTGLKMGTFIHNVTDAHVYDRHIPIMEELVHENQYMLSPAYATECFVPVTVELDPDVKEFKDFTVDSFQVKDYHPNEFKYKIPVAV